MISPRALICIHMIRRALKWKSMNGDRFFDADKLSARSVCALSTWRATPLANLIRESLSPSAMTMMLLCRLIPARSGSADHDGQVARRAPFEPPGDGPSESAPTAREMMKVP
jgi:hypothetical protein